MQACCRILGASGERYGAPADPTWLHGRPSIGSDLSSLPSRSTRYYNVITGKPLPSAAPGCTHAKTPTSALLLVAGSVGTYCEVPPAGFEPAHTAPEAVAKAHVSAGQSAA